MLENYLQQFGLQAKEARVYLGLLEIGQSPIQKITKKTGIKRTSVYDILDRLIKMGLVTMMIKNKRQFYFAENPEKLKNFWLSKQKEVDNKIKEFDKILPELKNIFNTSAVFQPKIKFFEGIEEIKKILDDFLTCQKKEYWALTPRKRLNELLGKEYMDEFVRKRVAAKIKCHTIRTKEDELLERKNMINNEKELRELYYLPAGINFTNTICVYDNKVAVISSKKENYGFIVESVELAETIETLIKMLWKKI